MTDKDEIIPKSLIDALRNKEVVPFIGAGVSLAVRKKKEDGAKSEESLSPRRKGYVELPAQTLLAEKNLTKPT